MSTKIAALLLLFVSTAFAQSPNSNFSVSTNVDAVMAKGVIVTFTYSLPADEPALKAAETDDLQAPAKITWMWGDESLGAPSKNFSESAHQKKNVATHVFAKPGIYNVRAIVTDKKGRLVGKAEVIKIKINAPVEIE